MEKMPKRESGISRIIGVEKEKEGDILEFFKSRFEAGEEKIDLEKERPSELNALILAVNEHMEEFLAHYGIDALDISPKNIHILDKQKLTPKQLEKLENEEKNTTGMFFAAQQCVVLLRDYNSDNRLSSLQTIVHEMMHFNAFHSYQRSHEKSDKSGKRPIEATAGPEKEITSLRPRIQGFAVYTTEGSKYFHDIDESITTELTMRFDWKYFPRIPQLEDELEKRQEAIEAESQRSGRSIEEVKKTLARITDRQREGGMLVASLEDYSYSKQRRDFNWLIDDLYQRNTSRFLSREDVFDLFVGAYMKGELLPIARLIEKAYGKGSFRRLGEVTKEK